MIGKKLAVLMGPFLGELYWECARFAPMLPYMRKKKFPEKDIVYIVLTREERFDLYGRYANILSPLRMPGDYDTRMPNCFGLTNYETDEYDKLTKDFYNKYKEQYTIIEHLFPNIKKSCYANKFQFPVSNMIYSYKPRIKNSELVENYLPKDGKKLIVLAPRFRKGFKRNWGYWPQFYDMIFNEKELFNKYNFIICGKFGEYIPDEKDRFLDMNKIKLEDGTSLVGLLLVILSKTFFTIGSQSSIPNMSLLYKIPVLEFGCQKALHTRMYNIYKTYVDFIENPRYDLLPRTLFEKMKENLVKLDK
jgi:hypothetical protein